MLLKISSLVLIQKLQFSEQTLLRGNSSPALLLKGSGQNLILAGLLAALLAYPALSTGYQGMVAKSKTVANQCCLFCRVLAIINFWNLCARLLYRVFQIKVIIDVVMSAVCCSLFGTPSTCRYLPMHGEFLPWWLN